MKLATRASAAVLKKTTRSRRGQSMVEYMLVVSVLGIVLASGFKLLGDSTSASFENAREVVQTPYP